MRECVCVWEWTRITCCLEGSLLDIFLGTRDSQMCRWRPSWGHGFGSRIHAPTKPVIIKREWISAKNRKNTENPVSKCPLTLWRIFFFSGSNEDILWISHRYQVPQYLLCCLSGRPRWSLSYSAVLTRFKTLWEQTVLLGLRFSFL